MAENFVITTTVFNARDLEIAWSEDPTRWKWIKVDVPRPPIQPQEAAELLGVNWLEVRKIVTVEKLVFSNAEDYYAAFEVMMKEDASGWEAPVTLTWKKLDSEQTPHIIYQDMHMLPTNKWVPLIVGGFKHTDIEQTGIEFSMSQHDNFVKKGLVVRSLVITPILK